MAIGRFFLVALCFTMAGCGASESPQKRKFTPFAIEGLLIPGGIEQAKSTGFTDCKADYYVYTCSRAVNAEIFGVVPTSAKVSLNGGNNYDATYYSGTGDVRKLKPEQLSYRGVDVVFPEETYDPKCLKKKGLDASGVHEDCVKTKGVQSVFRALRKNGWVERHWKSYTFFVHHGMPVEISKRSGDNVVSFHPETLEIVDSHLSSEQSRRIQEQSQQERSKAVLDMMKS